MKIFKFGGASVKDAAAIKNVAVVLETEKFTECLIVVSAMGKTTNALEKVVQAYFDEKNYADEIENIKKNHLEITTELFYKTHPVLAEISHFFDDINTFLQRNKSPNYNFVYDQVVGSGEMISSKILSEYLNDIQFKNNWLDAREYIKTDSQYREGQVNWPETEEKIKNLKSLECYVTQGFIGSDQNNFTVTLGREGSDYSAAIFAYCLNAEYLTIWKDVPGVMTGDPRKFENVNLLSGISYEEAIEMAYYGASIIHPKTLQPLKQKNIPFYVKSFLNPKEAGTKVSVSDNNEYVETYILKENQLLIHVYTRDFSFIAEEHLSLIFSYLAKFNIKISLMQNSAISLALCVEDKYNNINLLNSELLQRFETEIIENVSLFTIRNADGNKLKNLYATKNILLEQISQQTVQMVIN